MNESKLEILMAFFGVTGLALFVVSVIAAFISLMACDVFSPIVGYSLKGIVAGVIMMFVANFILEPIVKYRKAQQI